MTNMKEEFPEFYQSKLSINDLENNSDNIIVLDTNFLLDIIQLPTDISKKYVESLKKVKDNLYIPYLVALEFNFKKSGIKKIKHYNIGKYKDNVQGSINSLEKNILTYSLINIKEKNENFSDQLLEVVKEFKENFLPMLDEKVAKAITEEENAIYEELISIIKNKIGEKYDQEFIDSVEAEGIIRYEKKQPPGFDDKNKDEDEEPTVTYGNIVYQRKFADLIIWKDIINHSKRESEKGCKVIYITNDGQSDKKNDLLYKVKKLTVGPHISLMHELQSEAQKELYILSNLQFVQLASDLSDDQMNEFKYLFNSEYKEVPTSHKFRYTKGKYSFPEDEEDRLTRNYLMHMDQINDLAQDKNVHTEISFDPERLIKTRKNKKDVNLINKKISKLEEILNLTEEQKLINSEGLENFNYYKILKSYNDLINEQYEDDSQSHI